MHRLLFIEQDDAEFVACSGCFRAGRGFTAWRFGEIFLCWEMLSMCQRQQLADSRVINGLSPAGAEYGNCSVMACNGVIVQITG